MAQCIVSGSVSTLLGNSVTDAIITVSVSTPFFTLDGELISGQIGTTTTDTNGDFSISVVRTTTLGKLVQFDVNYNTGNGSRRSKKYLLYVPETPTANFASMVASTYVPAPNNLFPAGSVTVSAISGLSATTAQAAFAEHQSDIDTLNTSSGSAEAHIAASSGVHGVTGSVVGTTDTQTLTNKTITGTFTGNLTGNASTSTLASTVTTNANLTGPITSTGNATAVAAQTGTGSTFVMNTSPTLVTPTLGVATATTINNTTIPSSKTLVVTTDKLSVLAATTSSELAGVISDETGTGSLVFSNSPTLVTPALGTPSALVGTNITGTASGLSIGGNAATSTLASTVTTNANLSGDVSSVGNTTTIGASKVTNAMLAGSIDLTAKVTGALPIANGGTGVTTRANAIAALLPSQAATSGQVLTSVNGAGGDPVWSAVALASSVSGTLPVANGGTGVTSSTGTGSTVLSNSPTLVTPTLGVATATSVTATTFTGALVGNASTATSATSATTATNLAGGSGGTIPYQSAAGTTAMLANGSAGQILQSNGGTAAPTWIAATTGAKNYITNGTFANNSTTGWSLGVTGALSNGLPTTTPTFGSGASGNLAISVVGTSPITSTYALSYASSAATTSGNMVASDAMTIDPSDRAKVLAYKFNYTVPVDGSTAAGFSGTSTNNFAVAAWDVTNSVWLGMAGAFNLVQKTGVGIAQGTFQTGATTASIRFVIYNNVATTSATTLYIDDVYMGPQSLAFGPAVSDLVAYTPTFTGFGTASAIETFWRRVGDSVEISGKFTCGTATAVEGRVSLPSGLTSDSAKVTSIKVAGVAGWETNTAGGLYSLIEPSVSYITFGLQSAGANTLTKLNGDSQGNTKKWTFFATVPVSGWSSNTVMSQDSDTRVVAVRATNTAGTSLPDGTTVPWATSTLDTHAGMNTNGTYTIPVSGTYRVSSTIRLSGLNLTTSQLAFLSIKKNGTVVSIGETKYGNGASVDHGIGVNDTIACVAGDTLIVVYNSNLTATLASTAAVNHISIDRLSGPAVVAASESVNAGYGTANTTSVANATTTFIDFGTKEWDSHSAALGAGTGNSTTASSTWRYVAPVSGVYDVSAIMAVNITTAAQNFQIIGAIAVNGTVKQQYEFLSNNWASADESVQVNGKFKLNAGDYISASVFHSSGSARNMSGSAAKNRISISRVGN